MLEYLRWFIKRRLFIHTQERKLYHLSVIEGAAVQIIIMMCDDLPELLASIGVGINRTD